MSVVTTPKISDDFLWTAVASHLPAARKSNTDFINFNCPLCGDRKHRGGVKRNHDGLGVYCFNCDFRTAYVLGKSLYRNMRVFLKAIGVSENEIKLLNLRSMQLKQMMGTLDPHQVEVRHYIPKFAELELPAKAKPLDQLAEEGCEDPLFIRAVEYALSRGDEIYDRANFHWSPDPEWADRLIIPFYFQDKIAGWTGRASDPAMKPRYKNSMQTGFLYNNHFIYHRDRQYILLVEGIVDAIAIDGVSPLGAKLSADQISWLNNSGKKIIVVPDMDEEGDRQIDRALDNDWMVAFPRLKAATTAGGNWWHPSCKDCADAVLRHGRLYTLRSIIETATMNKLEINTKRKWIR